MVGTAIGETRIVVSATLPERLSIVDNSVNIVFFLAVRWEFALQLQTGGDLVMQVMIDLSVAEIAQIAVLILLSQIWCILNGDVDVRLLTRY